MMIPYWVWFFTTSIALGAIAISSFVVIYMKYAELEKEGRRTR